MSSSLLFHTISGSRCFKSPVRVNFNNTTGRLKAHPPARACRHDLRPVKFCLNSDLTEVSEEWKLGPKLTEELNKYEKSDSYSGTGRIRGNGASGGYKHNGKRGSGLRQTEGGLPRHVRLRRQKNGIRPMPRGRREKTRRLPEGGRQGGQVILPQTSSPPARCRGFFLRHQQGKAEGQMLNAEVGLMWLHLG
jgi:hypothetical protein